MLLPHHFDRSLGRIEIELEVLVFFVFRIIIHTRLSSTLVISDWGWLRRFQRNFFLLLLVKLVQLTNVVELQYHVSVLVRTLSGLPSFNPLVEEVDALVVFFLEIGLDAFVLNVLEPIHGLLVCHFFVVKPVIDIACCVEYAVLSWFSVLDKLHVVLIKDYFLDIMLGLWTHEQGVRVAFFVALHNFIFEAKELEDLIETVWNDSTSWLMWKLRWLLGSEYFNSLDTFSELLELSKDNACFGFKFGL